MEKTENLGLWLPKEILCDGIEKVNGEKMSEAAAKFSIYRGAYKALCVMDEGKSTRYQQIKNQQTQKGPLNHYGSRDFVELVM